MNIFKWLFTKRIKSLDPGKVYVVQIPNSPNPDESVAELTSWATEIKNRYKIDIIFILENMSFVELPEGYVIEKLRKK